ncbi:ATP-binding protein [Pseudomonas sp. F1002]|uniref:ATP-binding protein n=1 Tax=Pseudomonas sp. F1002 TaxID=2738821 RepID=UPI0015A41FB8|nr:ATP-binding protein [Pseudomonas sp. F1002]NWB57909.1 ATP-binding protein [Pseudomonas sp. F1002]
MSQEMQEPESQSAGQELLRQRWIEGVPLVAIWGQQAGWSLSMPDPVLKRALEHASRMPGQAWNSLLTNEPLEAEFYDWLAERFRNRPASQLVTEAARVPWCAVFTSSFDSGLANCLAGEGREPEVILQGQPAPRVLRNTRRPPFYYLYGQAGRQVDSLKPPVNRQTLSQRRMAQALVMLGRVLETATPLGLVVIDGYDPSTDWLRAEELLAAISDAPKHGVLWCGSDPMLSEDDQVVFEELVHKGVIVRESRALGMIVNELVEAIGVPEPSRWDDPEVITLKNGRSIKTTPNLRLVTQASAVLVDDLWAVAPDQLTPSEMEMEFEAFHGNSASFRRIADGVQRGFAIEREFELALIKRVDQALEQHHAASAIVLHGQSGVGKTIALARLAIHAKRHGNAVLFVNRRVPQATDISDFLTAVDGQQGVTLLLVDTMSPVSRYNDLLRALRSVGHRVVVVGSSYRLSFDGKVPSRFVEARAQLNPAEQNDLLEMAQRYVPSVVARVRKEKSNEYVLAGFYRLLPHSRGRLSEGLGKEVDRARHELRKRAAKIPPQEPGALAQAFMKAGLPVDTTQFLPDARPDGPSDSPEARAIDLVMASSRLYKPVPLSIVLRAVGAGHGSTGTYSIDTLLELIRDQDLFRWIYSDEEQTDVLVMARLQIEARLICEARFGSATLEADAISSLIEAAVRAGPEGNDETAYVADLVHAVGPDGPEGSRYKESYAQIARSLSILRAKTMPNARLMLQESVLRRHYVRTHKNIEHPEKVALLNEAVNVVDEAFDRISQQGSSGLYAARQTVDNLWNERAATYGFFATDAVENGQNASAWSAYKAAHDAATLAKARRESSFSLDVSLWMPTGILKLKSTLTEAQRLEIAADLRSSIDGVDESMLDEAQKQKFQSRRMIAGFAMGDETLSDDAFAQLEQAGSTAGYFMRARDLAPAIMPQTEPSAQDIAGAKRCVNYLRQYYDKISQDERCLRLLLDMEWAIRTQKWFMRGLRQPFPAVTDFREMVQDIVGDMALLGEDKLATKYRYLRAVTKWLAGNERTSRELWTELASDTEFADSQRVSSRHVLTDANGTPIIYRGIVEKQIGPGRFQVRVEGIGVIDLLAEYFPNVEIAFGRTVSNFHIAFNYRGPLADPPGKVRRLGR